MPYELLQNFQMSGFGRCVQGNTTCIVNRGFLVAYSAKDLVYDLYFTIISSSRDRIAPSRSIVSQHYR